MQNTFTLLRRRCGLSQHKAAEFLEVRLDTIKSWDGDRRGVPDRVIAELRELYNRMRRAAFEALAIMDEMPDGDVELGLANDDEEARALGFPCVDSHAAVLGMIVGKTTRKCVIVPRGSTVATAAAREVHGVD